MVSFSRPISNLPTEILTIIFHEATDLEVRQLQASFHLPPRGDALSTQPQLILAPRPGTSPWNIAQVCQSWRRISIATPTLWSDVFVSVFHAYTWFPEPPLPALINRFPVAQYPVLQRILWRSHPAPLRVRLGASTSPPVLHLVQLALNRLLAHGHRIELLDIYVPLASPMPIIPLPKLRHLSLREGYNPTPDQHPLLSVAHLHMPVLTRIDYFGCSLDNFALTASSIVWGSITVLNLRLAWIAWQTIVHLLTATVELHTLSISVIRYEPGQVETPASTAVLPSLAHISLQIPEPDILLVLGAIQTPGLRLLDLRSVSFIETLSLIVPHDEVVTKALNNIASAQATLATLRVIDFSLPCDILRELLSRLEHLHHLAIRWRGCTMTWLGEPAQDLTNLIEDWTNTPLSPELESLSLMSHTWDFAPQGTVLQLVRSRCQPEDASRLGVRPLRHLAITRRHCALHSRIYDRDEMDIALLKLPSSSSVEWRDRDFDGKSPGSDYYPCDCCSVTVADVLRTHPPSW